MARDVLLLSNSEMAEFRRCRRRWYLGTYRRLQRRAVDLPGSPLKIGNLVHDSLAEYYGGQSRGETVDPVAHAQQLIDQEAAENPFWEEDLMKDRALVTIMLEGYLEWLAETGIDADLKILGAETMVDVQLAAAGENGGEVRLISKLDAPVERESDGLRLALEHKTVQSLIQPLPLLKIDSQMLTEHLARYLHLMEAGADSAEAHASCLGILYNMLRKVKRTAASKPPYFGREDVTHNVEELRHHWRHVMGLAREIQRLESLLDAGVDHHTVCPPSPRRECSYDCEFFKVCHMLDDGSDAEGAIEALYEVGDPLERYQGAASLVDAI